MGEKVEQARATRSVNIPAALADRLSKEADRRDVSVTFLVTKAVERLLPTWERVDLNATFPLTNEVPDA